jgi:diguanylate cyclase (GGDEF)-like protein/PAS domain S-box-containing protein
MRIRTQLLAAIVVTLSLGCVAAWLLVRAAQDQSAASETQARAQTTSHEVSGLLVLTQEYARHSEGRSAQQWHQRHVTIATVLSDENAGAVLKELRSVTQALPQLFNRLEELPAGEDSFTLQRKEVLIDQLLTSTQAMSDLAYQWYQEAAQQRRTAEQRFQTLALVTPLTMLVLLIAVAAIVRQRVLGPLGSLTDATGAVSRGDLGVRVAIDRRDEFGELSRRFDEMTMALAGSDEQLRRSEKRLRDITDNIPAMVGYFDAEERCLYANTTVLKAHGIDRKDTLRHTLRSGLGEDSYALHEPHVRRALQGEFARFEGHLVRGGRDVYFQAHVVPDKADDSSVRGFYVMTFDVTAVRQAEIDRARSEQQLRQIADNLPVLISYIDKDQRVRFANETYRTWLGADPLTLLGMHVRDVVGSRLYEPRGPYLERALRGERVEFENEATALGVTRTTHTSYIPDLDQDGSVQGIYTLSSDVTALKEVERKLQALARYDTLTGLPNRLLVNEKLPEVLARADRTGNALALMYLDVDRFKAINDGLGHAAGDEVLQEFARRLVTSVRTTDTVARLAGDEFVIILEGLHDHGEVHAIAQKIVNQVSLPMQVGERELAVTTSVGVAFHDPSQPATTAALLLAKADEALYAAKRAGKSTFRVASTAPQPEHLL